MREILTHKVHEQDRQPQVLAGEERSIGGAPDCYKIVYSAGEHVHVPFITLDNPGVTNEALLAILQDRLEGFQAGEFPCQENQVALEAVREAQAALHRRTLDRIARRVENQAKA